MNAMTDSYRVRFDDDVPAPKRGRPSANFPWHKMQVGQSFFVPSGEPIPRPGKKLLETGYRVSIAKEGDGKRVWRTA